VPLVVVPEAGAMEKHVIISFLHEDASKAISVTSLMPSPAILLLFFRSTAILQYLMAPLHLMVLPLGAEAVVVVVVAGSTEEIRKALLANSTIPGEGAVKVRPAISHTKVVAGMAGR